MRGALRITLVALALSLVGAGAGAAQAQGPAYVAQPPSKGAFTSDGNWNRYLLGGTWLYRADPGNAGAIVRSVEAFCGIFPATHAHLLRPFCRVLGTLAAERSS